MPLLGDTAKNIRSIFDFVPSREAVLFIDEMDAVAKVRDDRHELGELKRVVNTVIQGLDSLDDRAGLDDGARRACSGRSARRSRGALPR